MIRALLYKIPQDKRDHALVGLVLFTLFAPFSPFAAFLIVVAAASGWEAYQKISGTGKVEWHDILATTLIPGIGVLLWAFF